MLRLSPPAAIATGHNRSRAAARPHTGLASRRAPILHEPLRPADLGLQLFVYSRDALVVGNLESGRIVLWNPSAERLFGWTAAEAVGQPLDLLIPGPILRLHQEEVALYRRTHQGASAEPVAPIEVPVRTRTGEDIRVEWSLVDLEPPPTGSAAGGTFVLAMLRDASDRRRADLQSVELARADLARQELERALEVQQHLFEAGAAEIQHALTRLQRSAQRLTRSLSAQRHMLQARIVDIRVARLRRMLDELSICALIHSGRLTLQTERVNLVPLVNRVAAEARARSTPCKVNVALPQGLTAQVDARLLELVVRTLLDQAMIRNPRGCWVDFDLRRPLAGLARLEVRDVGRPISDRLRQRLLDSDSPDRSLAMSRYIVEQHGGTLRVELPTEGGVRVVLTLPTQRGRVLPGTTS